MNPEESAFLNSLEKQNSNLYLNLQQLKYLEEQRKVSVILLGRTRENLKIFTSKKLELEKQIRDLEQDIDKIFSAIDSKEIKVLINSMIQSDMSSTNFREAKARFEKLANMNRNDKFLFAAPLM